MANLQACSKYCFQAIDKNSAKYKAQQLLIAYVEPKDEPIEEIESPDSSVFTTTIIEVDPVTDKPIVRTKTYHKVSGRHLHKRPGELDLHQIWQRQNRPSAKAPDDAARVIKVLWQRHQRLKMPRPNLVPRRAAAVTDLRVCREVALQTGASLLELADAKVQTDAPSTKSMGSIAIEAEIIKQADEKYETSMDNYLAVSPNLSVFEDLQLDMLKLKLKSQSTTSDEVLVVSGIFENTKRYKMSICMPSLVARIKEALAIEYGMTPTMFAQRLRKLNRDHVQPTSTTSVNTDLTFFSCITSKDDEEGDEGPSSISLTPSIDISICEETTVTDFGDYSETLSTTLMSSEQWMESQHLLSGDHANPSFVTNTTEVWPERKTTIGKRSKSAGPPHTASSLINAFTEKEVQFFDLAKKAIKLQCSNCKKLSRPKSA